MWHLLEVADVAGRSLVVLQQSRGVLRDHATSIYARTSSVNVEVGQWRPWHVRLERPDAGHDGLANLLPQEWEVAEPSAEELVVDAHITLLMLNTAETRQVRLLRPRLRRALPSPLRVRQ